MREEKARGEDQGKSQGLHRKVLGIFLFITVFLVPRAMPWRRQWHPTPVLLPGKSHGRGSLVGCSPWGCKQSDTTEQLARHTSLHCIFRLKPPHLLVHLICICSTNIQFNASANLSSCECILVCHWSLSLLKYKCLN